MVWVDGRMLRTRTRHETVANVLAEFANQS
jgi:hypothetical protein